MLVVRCFQYMMILFDRASSMERRVRQHKARVADRSRIIWMWLAGIPPQNISTQNGVSISTVYRWIRRWQKEGTLKTCYSAGPRKSWWGQVATAATATQSQPSTETLNASPIRPLYWKPPTVNRDAPNSVNIWLNPSYYKDLASYNWIMMKPN